MSNHHHDLQTSLNQLNSEIMNASTSGGFNEASLQELQTNLHNYTSPEFDFGNAEPHEFDNLSKLLQDAQDDDSVQTNYPTLIQRIQNVVRTLTNAGL